jgi:DNA-binding winged helix-turn-helix (wHTH) protein/TolB-like protein
MIAVEPPHFYTFGPFRLDPVKRLLLREGAGVSLTPKALDTLLVLIEHRGQVLEKDELMKRLWPDSFVEEANLAVNISALRKALGEQPHEHHYIVTVPGRGYRFVANVEQSTSEGPGLLVERTDTSIVHEEGAAEGAAQGIERPKSTALPLSGNTPARTSRTVNIVLACVVVAITVIAVALYRQRSSSGESRPIPIHSIAVLPLKNLSDDPSNEYFSDGMTESLISALSQVSDLKVISRGSVIRFKGTETDPREVGKQLAVAAVLEGSVRKAPDSVRVAVQLVSVDDGCATQMSGRSVTSSLCKTR